MLINLSNHASANWSQKQMEAAIHQFGQVVDFPFPQIDPEFDINEIANLAETIFNQIFEKYEDLNFKIHLMGELSLVYQLLLLFKKRNIDCYVSTTHRAVEELEDGSKKVRFNFVKFRSYFVRGGGR